MDISYLGKTFNQIELELDESVNQTESYRLKIVELYWEKDLFGKYKKIEKSSAQKIAHKIQSEFKKIDNPTTIYKNVSNFKDYRFSYLDSAILTRNAMIKEGDTNLVYSYLFLISHYIELVIKAVLLSKNEGIEATHNIASIFSNNKKYLLEIGLDQKYFDYCLNQVRKLSKYAVTEDFSMCFRYPLDRNFKKKVITNDLLTITIDELKQMVEEHKYLMIILELIIQLSEKHFYETVCEFIKNLLNEFESNING